MEGNQEKFNKVYDFIEKVKHDELIERSSLRARMTIEHAALTGQKLSEEFYDALRALENDSIARILPVDLMKINFVLSENGLPNDKELSSRIYHAVDKILDKYTALYYDKCNIKSDEAEYVYHNLSPSKNGWAYQFSILERGEDGKLHDTLFDFNSSDFEGQIKRYLVTKARNDTGYALKEFDYLFKNAPETDKQEKQTEPEHSKHITDDHAAKLRMRAAFNKNDWRAV